MQLMTPDNDFISSVKSFNSGKWVYGLGFFPFDNTNEFMMLVTMNLNKIKVKTDSICRYIGKLDTNSKPVYENDIVLAKTPYGNDHKIIIWDPIRCRFFLKSSFVAYDSKNQYSLAQKKVTIVGNVLDTSRQVPSIMLSVLSDMIITKRLRDVFMMLD